MATLSFDIPDEELARVSKAFCSIAGHPPCHDPDCLLGQITKIVVRRTVRQEKLIASKNAEANVPPLSIILDRN